MMTKMSAVWKNEPHHSVGLIHFPVVSLAVHLLKGEAKMF